MPAKSLQSRPTLCNPMDCSLSGSFVYGILQVRILELVAISSSSSGVWGDERRLDDGTQVGMKEDTFTKAPRKTLSPRMCCVCAQLLQSCSTCCDPMDCSLPGSSVHGILQARILDRVTVHLTGTPEDWGWFLLHVGNAVSTKPG